VPKDAQYSISLDGDRLVVEPLEADAAVAWTATAADAEALAAGKLDLAVAFMQGRVKAAGDGKALLELLKNSS
jgi:predicted lipid carrier protein YhbT